MTTLPSLDHYADLSLADLATILHQLDVTQPDFDAHMDALERRLHIIRAEVKAVLTPPRPANPTPAPFRLLIAGSRQASATLLQKAHEAVVRAHARQWTVVVGDAEGVDNAVIAACNEVGVDYVCFGITATPRTTTYRAVQEGGKGRYVQHDGDYASRDRRMAEVAHRGLFLWNGESRGTKAGYDYLCSLGKPADLLTDPAVPPASPSPNTPPTSTPANGSPALVEVIVDTGEATTHEDGEASNFTTTCLFRALAADGKLLSQKRHTLEAAASSSDCAKMLALLECLTLLRARVKHGAAPYRLRLVQSSRNIDGWMAHGWQRHAPQVVHLTHQLDEALRAFPAVEWVKHTREQVQSLLTQAQ